MNDCVLCSEMILCFGNNFTLTYPHGLFDVECVELCATILELGIAGRGLPKSARNNTRNLQISSRSPRTGQSRARWWWDVRNISTIVYQDGIRFGCNGSVEKLKPESITQREFSEHQNLPKQDLLFLGENLSVELQFLTSLEQ